MVHLLCNFIFNITLTISPISSSNAVNDEMFCANKLFHFRTFTVNDLRKLIRVYQTKWVIKDTNVLIKMVYFIFILTSFSDFVYNRTIRNQGKLGNPIYA